MAVIGEKELRAQLKSGTLSHAYFIYGDEGYLKDHYIGQIKKKAVDPAFAAACATWGLDCGSALG